MLLENDGSLPIKPGKLSLFGAGAAYTIQGGSGSGEVNARHTVSALEGLENSGFTVTTKDWIHHYDTEWKAGKEAFLRENQKKLYQFNAKALADLLAAEYRYPSGGQISEEELRVSGTDTCVYILSRQSGEGHDRRDEPGSYRLTQVEENNIRLCAERYRCFILVINAGAPIDLSPLAANNQEENRYFVSSDLDERTLREIYLRGFEIAVRKARPKAVMSAYNKLNGVYCANNRELCTDILRGEWGFDGIVMTDWLATGKDRAEEAKCLKSGVDLIMPGGKGTVKALLAAYKEGQLSIDCLRQSCGRVLGQILNHQLTRHFSP